MNQFPPPGARLAIALATACLGLSASSAAAQPQTPESPPPVRNVVYAERDEGVKLLCDIYLPEGPGPFPGVLCVHGGAWAAGSKSQLAHVGQMLGERGYVAVAINYRLAPQYKYPAQLEDVRDAARWMRSQAGKYRIDPDRIGGLGYSAGAQLIAVLGLSAGSLAGPPQPSDQELPVSLRAMVCGGTPCDFRQLPEHSTALAYWLGGTRAQQPERYRAASPASFVRAGAPPAFFFHGQSDALVPLANVQSMVQQLKQAGSVAELHVVPESGHIAAFFDIDGYRRAIDFLDKHLQPDQTPQTGSGN